MTTSPTTERSLGTPSSIVTRSDLRFTLLGPLEIVKDGVDHAPTAPKVLQLMALLVLDAGRVVRLDTIVEELWGDNPPRSLRTTVQTYVYQLRRCITEHRLAPDAEQLLATRGPGYVLRIAPEQVDVDLFRTLHDRGRQQLAAGRYAEAAVTLTRALEVPSGPPLADVACGAVLTARVVGLQEQLRDTRHLRAEAAIACGAHRGLLAELRTRAVAEPFDEDLHGQLIRVLAGNGRRSEAMSVYRDLRGRLVRDLGVEPCSALQSLHLDLLSDAG